MPWCLGNIYLNEKKAEKSHGFSKIADCWGPPLGGTPVLFISLARFFSKLSTADAAGGSGSPHVDWRAGSTLCQRAGTQVVLETDQSTPQIGRAHV